jgi:hypothetical protein
MSITVRPICLIIQEKEGEVNGIIAYTGKEETSC